MVPFEVLRSTMFNPLDVVGRVLAPAALRLRGRRRPRWLTVLAYHRVLPAPASDYPYDRAVIDCDPDAFATQMELVARECTPVTLDDVLGMLRGEPLPPNPVLVTFDDGYKDNREHAFPVLDRLGIPAVFFVATSYVGAGRLFWWDRVATLFGHSTVAVARLRYPTDVILRVRAEPEQSRQIVLRFIKTCRGLDVDRFLDELAAALGVPWDDDADRAAAASLVMTWDDVRELASAGMEIGSHTHTHRVLHTLDTETVVAELVRSRSEIEKATGKRPRAISYPVGRPLRKMPALMRAVRDAGYQIGFTAEPRGNRAFGEIEPFDMARVPVDAGVSRHHLRALLAAPELARAW